jgi:MFS family permease
VKNDLRSRSPPLTSVGLLGAFLAPIGAGGIIGIAGYRPTFLIVGAVGVVGIRMALRAPRLERSQARRGIVEPAETLRYRLRTLFPYWIQRKGYVSRCCPHTHEPQS